MDNNITTGLELVKSIYIVDEYILDMLESHDGIDESDADNIACRRALSDLLEMTLDMMELPNVVK